MSADLHRGDGRGASAFVLAAVLVVVVVLTLLAGTALVLAEAEATAARGSLRREQSRLTAWSGVRAVMVELARQREALSQGQSPELTAGWVLSGEAGRPRMTVRLLEVEPGRLVVPEAGKLDLNSAAAEALTASGALEIGEADAVVAARASAAFGSVGDALETLPEKAPATTAFEGELAGQSGKPLLAKDAVNERLTVFAFEPNLQAGAGGLEAGSERIFIGDGWTDELKPALGARLSARAAAAVEKGLRAGSPKSMGDVVGVLRQEQVPVREWPAVLDALTVSPDAYLAGRVDVHSARREVLRALPGMSDALAEQVVRTRDRIDPEARLSVVWLVQQGVLTAGQFQGLVDSITGRCFQWRVRVEGGFGGEGESPAQDRVILEAVVDLSGATPRLAYLRDITHLESVEVVAALREEQGSVEPERAGGLEAAADLELKTELGDIEVELGARMENDASELRLSPLELSGGLELGGPGGGRPRAGGEPKGSGPGVDRRVGRWKIPARPAKER